MNTMSYPNTASRIAPGTLSFENLRSFILAKDFWLMVVLLLAVFISALTVIYVQEKDRLLFSQLSSLQKQRDALHVEWGQLLLEESTWATQARVQHVATQQLNMIMPQQKNIVMVQL